MFFTLRTGLMIVLPALLALGSDGASAQTPEPSAAAPWRDVAEDGIPLLSERRIAPAAYRTVALDRAQLEAILARAPHEADVPAAASPTRLALPHPDGGYEHFHIVESPIMEAGLAAKFPQIRTWLGQGIDDPTATLRFDLTPAGFHAQVLSAQGSRYIDPFQPDDVAHYQSYFKADARRGGEPMRCLLADEALDPDASPLPGPAPELASGDTLRTYRLAMAATGEFTAFHGGTVAAGLAAIVTTMNRVNGIYERELGVRMVLVANNDLVVYTNGATDPYSNGSGGAMLGQNQTNLTNVIGSANYDIGHVVSTGGGGVAGLGVVCSASSKARGVTGQSAPIGDPFDVDYVAHEIGHQFGGNHTFNGSGANCSGGNRNGGTAYEPGSGITIQAYAGICAADNLQSNSNDYFHRISLNEMLGFVTSGGGNACDAATATGNTPPQVFTDAAFSIPARTPFTLSASGSDADGDTLTYLWEQMDLGAANAPGVLTDNGGPLFRSYAPSTSPSRTFPSLPFILDHANQPPATTGGFFTAELLPTTSRQLRFRATVRDNRAGGGGTNDALVTLSVIGSAGPFAVTAPNTNLIWPAGSTRTVSWNVAGTTAAPISTATVRIELSLDGGQTWPILLAQNEPNDGAASVLLPQTSATTAARVRVAAENNVYFDVSDVDFSIVGVDLSESDGSSAVAEGGSGDSYDLVLQVAPTGTVAVSIDAGAQLQATPATLEFTPANWNLPRTVTLAAVDDTVVEGPHVGIVNHVLSGGGYDGVAVAPLVVDIADDDIATLSAQDVIASEGDGPGQVQIELALAGQVAAGFSVDYTTRDDSALAGTHYVATSGSVYFDSAPDPDRTFSIDLIGDDVPEADTRFFVDLSLSVAGVVLATPTVEVQVLDDDVAADLSAEVVREPGSTVPGSTVRYLITLRNTSALVDVAGATVSIGLPASLTAVSWTCAGSDGGQCPSGGSGAPSHGVDLPAGARVTYTLDASIDASTASGSLIALEATVAVPLDVIDPAPENNAAVDGFVVPEPAIFADGFETPD